MTAYATAGGGLLEITRHDKFGCSALRRERRKSLSDDKTLFYSKSKSV